MISHPHQGFTCVFGTRESCKYSAKITGRQFPTQTDVCGLLRLHDVRSWSAKNDRVTNDGSFHLGKRKNRLFLIMSTALRVSANHRI